MDQEIAALDARLERLLELTRRLGDENVRLRAECDRLQVDCAGATSERDRLRARMTEACARVEAALSRLPHDMQSAEPHAPAQENA